MRKREDRLDINGSGYFDPTAGEALKIVANDGNNVKRGEVWSAYFGNAERRLAILATSGNLCSVLMINEESKGMRDKPVVTESGKLGYYMPCMLSYKFVADLDAKVDSLAPSELDGMLHECAKVLGISASMSEPVKTPEPVKAPGKAEQELREEIIRLTAARDLYREEYRHLLALQTGK